MLRAWRRGGGRGYPPEVLELSHHLLLLRLELGVRRGLQPRDRELRGLHRRVEFRHLRRDLARSRGALQAAIRRRGGGGGGGPAAAKRRRWRHNWAWRRGGSAAHPLNVGKGVARLVHRLLRLSSPHQSLHVVGLHLERRGAVLRNEPVSPSLRTQRERGALHGRGAGCRLLVNGCDTAR